MTAALAEPRRSAEEQQRLDTALTDLFQHRIVFNQTLGLVIESARPQAPRIRFDMRHELIGSPTHGRLHGGVISATLDAMGGFAIMVALADKHADEALEQLGHRFGRVGTIDLRVDYLRQGLGRHFVATAEITRLGGRVASTQMRLANDEGTLIATAAAAYMIS
jgi:uncharacterized protein (TIGR00369 family)